MDKSPIGSGIGSPVAPVIVIFRVATIPEVGSAAGLEQLGIGAAGMALHAGGLAENHLALTRHQRHLAGNGALGVIEIIGELCAALHVGAIDAVFLFHFSLHKLITWTCYGIYLVLLHTYLQTTCHQQDTAESRE